MAFKRTKRINIANKIITLGLLIVTLSCLYPLWYTIMISLSDKSAVEGGMVTFWPVGFNLFSYETILKDPKFLTAFGVSVKRVVLGGAVNFFITAIMAYPLSKNTREFRARNIYMWFILFNMLFAGGLVPWYLNIKNLGLIDSIWALVLPGAVPIFNIILLMNFYRNLPKELEEAALVDGAGPWFILFRIFIPLSLPALATVTLFIIVGHWNAYFDGLVLMNSAKKYPLQTYIQQLVVNLNTDKMSKEEVLIWTRVSNKTLNGAKIVVAMVPILLVYPFLQRYFITGITLGSVKE